MKKKRKRLREEVVLGAEEVKRKKTSTDGSKKDDMIEPIKIGPKETKGREKESKVHLSPQQQKQQQQHPWRDVSGLHASIVTIDCAINQGCVPCAYKIGCFDVALDKEFCKSIPNQRPENCPRLKGGEMLKKDCTAALGYRAGMRVLTVGDGDFTFSLSLARIMAQTANSIKHDTNHPPAHGLVATSYESKETLLDVYPGLMATLSELEALGAKIFYRVDATCIPETLGFKKSEDNEDSSSGTGPGESYPLQKGFHRIVWNFPCTAVTDGQDGQNDAMENNKQLIRRFMMSAKPLLVTVDDHPEDDPNNYGVGEIHMNHKTKPPYDQWKIQEVALEGEIDSSMSAKFLERGRECNDNMDNKATTKNLRYEGRVVMDRCLFPPYIPRKALNKKSFPVHDACTYVFSATKNNTKVDDATKGTSLAGSSSVDEPYTGQLLKQCNGIVPVSLPLLERIRDSLLEARTNRTPKRITKKPKLLKKSYKHHV